MNLLRVKEAEAAFLERYPPGFQDPGLAPIRKRHNVDKLTEFARENLNELAYGQPQRFCDLLLTIIGRSSMVSRFEKAPFRDAINSLSSKDKQKLTDAFEKRLKGRRKRASFEEIVDFFGRYRLAKWALVSAVPFYFAPQREAFVKPTTAKMIIAKLEVSELEYRPRPDWQFYSGYLKLIDELKVILDPSLTTNNAAITGFLMTSL